MKRLAAVIVSCVAAAALLALAAWIALGGSDDAPPDAAVQLISPAQETVDGTRPGTTQSTPSDQTENAPAPTEVTVYITGAVINPGVYSATSDHRLDHVLMLAGGPTGDADLARINLAAHLTDAAHYQIPSVDDPEIAAPPIAAPPSAAPPSAAVPIAAPPSASPANANSCAVPININNATTDCLETLPGIGMTRAESIVAHREEKGPFIVADDIMNVSGIGDGIYRRIADLIAVADP